MLYLNLVALSEYILVQLVGITEPVPRVPSRFLKKIPLQLDKGSGTSLYREKVLRLNFLPSLEVLPFNTLQ